MTPVSKTNFQSDQEVRWCPGCGDYAILASVQKVLADMPIPREKHVFVSGIGCASRFPYYMNTYGFHTIHGRAPTIATGLKCVRPDLTVWVVTGDGDGLSIGGNHLLHVLRRNVDVKVLLFNNRIYGLTKGQYSPTSTHGHQSVSTPDGAIDYPVNPIGFALSAGATFVARAMDADPKHLMEVLARTVRHKGAAFVEILQNCVVFNDQAFGEIADRSVRMDQCLYLKEGEPLLFGKNMDRALGFKDFGFFATSSRDGTIPVHRENAEVGYSYLLSQLTHPQPLGVFRSVLKATYDDQLNQQVDDRKTASSRDLTSVLRSAPIWDVH